MSEQRPGHDILVIDDDLAMLELLTSLLEDEGFAARAAASGASGLAMMDEAPPALVLLDWMMPSMRGDEVLRAIRSGAHRDVPVVVLSASGDARSLLAEGANEFLAKPFDIDELLACIARLLPTS